jgi:hypothetical protein
MRYKKVKLSAVFFLILGLSELYAQQTIPASGGNASGSSGSVSYTVGQVVYTNIKNSSGSITQGIQQTFDITVVNEIKDAKDIILNCSAYPNPVSDFLKLTVENYKTENLTYQLFDINGNFFENKKVEGDETSINMEKLVPATYFLKVTDGNKEVKTFKIIKN